MERGGGSWGGGGGQERREEGSERGRCLFVESGEGKARLTVLRSEDGGWLNAGFRGSAASAHCTVLSR